ncbi:MAG: UbiX family flavin prenyltransferase [Verrucomicrobiales bacterium]|jgi:4-hydroxy-3-polyprenylbenzoate decarboxylase|nr:UbiX family flavin prenyltransferase [Verrucomicrobiales bacterium]
MKLIIGISGATGGIYAVRLLEKLRRLEVETHLVISQGARLTLPETSLTVPEVEQLAAVVHRDDNLAAPIASGSFKTDGMIIAPCSMRTLAAVAHGAPYNLLTRAADVTLKERRRLVLLARETPLTLAHLRNMASVTLMGGIIYPPLPVFYHPPRTVAELIDTTVARALDLLGLDDLGLKRWAGR